MVDDVKRTYQDNVHSSIGEHTNRGRAVMASVDDGHRLEFIGAAGNRLLTHDTTTAYLANILREMRKQTFILNQMAGLDIENEDTG